MKCSLRKDLIEKGEYPSMFICLKGYENDTPKCISERLLAGESFDAWTLDLDTDFNALVKIDERFYRFPNIDFEEVENKALEALGDIEASLIDLELVDEKSSEMFDLIRKAVQ